MLLRYALGEEKAAQRIEAAVMGALDKGFRTGDIMSPGMVFLSFFIFHNIFLFRMKTLHNNCFKDEQE